MLNYAYRDNESPHVHWHVLARINKPLKLFEEVFSEPNFGEHYNINHHKIIDLDLKMKLTNFLKENYKSL
jgi:diadenosine tetraphosphate (Ap4A) HIT family hydrolase